MFKIQSSVNLRILILGLMLLGFLIPLGMVGGLVSERQERARSSVQEIGSKWGMPQTVAGPFLVVPYTFYSEKNQDGISTEIEGEIYFLPDELDMETDLKTEKRKRGIYEAILYSGDLKIKGNFKTPSRTDFPNGTKSIQWENARLIVSISDPKGIGNDLELVVAGKEKTFQPGSSSPFIHSGLYAKHDLSRSNHPLSFQIKIPVKGSESMYLVPLGKRSLIHMSSDWKDPSFEGAILPKSRNITESGFQAEWESSYFGRNYPQTITYMDSNTMELILYSGYGVRLIVPVDHYLKLDRSLKYAILFLATSFTLFFLLEIFGGKILHPLQYLMIGSAMVIFYILTLSLSEQLGFGPAYIVASIAVSGLVSYYAGAVLQSVKRGILAGAYYIGLYSFLYVVLDSEDNSLLLGSVAIFVLLAVLMHLTRKIDWYSFGSKEKQVV
ncbi:cell envelope integrity protein CreD [Leptospira langatensis]|uniref:Cell envelope integrity protein CreD n=1 Tax=Leptospira langatensis TaxID=2484983 RepID=A0A5F1ZX99_9LEPT|nr:cell envelope integrity protein CreD [Leptospira langatensis]TGJ98582.1 cell envelope integrity protein CreD [Leptospira langatensis]TGL43495.1 cell envelope integrity protein CreD [Leptospira langatensis]